MMNVTVEIAPCADSSGNSLVHGHWGLGDDISFRGRVRIATQSRINPITPECPSFILHSCRVSVHGDIFTSNGDARNHSPYESRSFLNLGPYEFLKDDSNAAAPEAGGGEATSAGTVIRTRDSRANKGGNDVVAKVPPPPAQPAIINDDGSIDVPFVFPVSWENGDKLHASLFASDPEWGFGARIAYRIVATVCLTDFPSSVPRMATAIPVTNASNAVTTAESQTLLKAPLISLWPAVPPNLSLRHLLNPQTFFRNLCDAWRTMKSSTVTVDRPLILLRHTPAGLIRAVREPPQAKRWSSATDEPPDNPNDAATAAMIDYEVSFSPLTFGPLDVLTIRFKVRPKPATKVRVARVRFSLSEMQGVGVEIGEGMGGDRVAESKILGELNRMMSDTTLGRKWMAEEIMSWSGMESVAGEFWKDQEIRLQVPPLRATVPPSTLFGPRYKGINPSGRFAYRVQIEHKVNIHIDLCNTTTSAPMAPLALSPVQVFVNGYGHDEALDLVSAVPSLKRQLLSLSIATNDGGDDDDEEQYERRLQAERECVPRYKSQSSLDQIPRYSSSSSLK